MVGFASAEPWQNNTKQLKEQNAGAALAMPWAMPGPRSQPHGYGRGCTTLVKPVLHVKLGGADPTAAVWMIPHPTRTAASMLSAAEFSFCSPLQALLLHSGCQATAFTTWPERGCLYKSPLRPGHILLSAGNCATSDLAPNQTRLSRPVRNCRGYPAPDAVVSCRMWCLWPCSSAQAGELDLSTTNLACGCDVHCRLGWALRTICIRRQGLSKCSQDCWPRRHDAWCGSQGAAMAAAWCLSLAHVTLKHSPQHELSASGSESCANLH